MTTKSNKSEEKSWNSRFLGFSLFTLFTQHRVWTFWTNKVLQLVATNKRTNEQTNKWTNVLTNEVTNAQHQKVVILYVAKNYVKDNEYANALFNLSEMLSNLQSVSWTLCVRERNEDGTHGEKGRTPFTKETVVWSEMGILLQMEKGLRKKDRTLLDRNKVCKKTFDWSKQTFNTPYNWIVLGGKTSFTQKSVCISRIKLD